ncbi:hypothetical protein IPJ72_00405 [Candidatus Peregrinibacteria bacterium]|nr:MAG: hypothetical protein IPJ72_00405 [Candidatus Peregrinibacteria bacterium]
MARTIKNIVIVLIFTALCGIILMIVYRYTRTDSTVNQKVNMILDNAIYVCKRDSDCVVVPDGPCPCSSSGRGKAINKKFDEIYRATHERGICAAAISQHPTCTTPPTCENRKCVIATDNLNSCTHSNNIDYCIENLLDADDSSGRCEDVAKSLKNVCYEQLAIKKGEVDLCRLITDKERSQACNDLVIFRSAKDADDYTICYQISDKSEFRTKCLFSKIAYGDITDEAACDLINDIEKATKCADIILGRRGEETNDESACYKITDSSRQDECIEKVGISKQDLALCEQVGSAPGQSRCISSIAEKTNNFELCSQVVYSNFGQHCRAAIIKNDQLELDTMIDICEMQQEGHFKQSCYEKLRLNQVISRGAKRLPMRNYVSIK